MRCTNFLSGAITSARLTPCQKSICRRRGDEKTGSNRYPKSHIFHCRFPCSLILSVRLLDYTTVSNTSRHGQAHSMHKSKQVGKLDIKMLYVTNLGIWAGVSRTGGTGRARRRLKHRKPGVP